MKNTFDTTIQYKSKLAVGYDLIVEHTNNTWKIIITNYSNDIVSKLIKNNIIFNDKLDKIIIPIDSTNLTYPGMYMPKDIEDLTIYVINILNKGE